MGWPLVFLLRLVYPHKNRLRLMRLLKNKNKPMVMPMRNKIKKDRLLSTIKNNPPTLHPNTRAKMLCPLRTVTRDPPRKRLPMSATHLANSNSQRLYDMTCKAAENEAHLFNFEVL
jgi:hypothetical protein